MLRSFYNKFGTKLQADSPDSNNVTVNTNNVCKLATSWLAMNRDNKMKESYSAYDST